MYPQKISTAPDRRIEVPISAERTTRPHASWRKFAQTTSVLFEQTGARECWLGVKEGAAWQHTVAIERPPNPRIELVQEVGFVEKLLSCPLHEIQAFVELS
jgi:hypothetical protein